MATKQELNIHGRRATAVIPEGWEISRWFERPDSHIVIFKRPKEGNSISWIEVNFHPDRDPLPSALQVCPNSRGYTLYLNGKEVPWSVSGTLGDGDLSITLKVSDQGTCTVEVVTGAELEKNQ